MPERVTREEKIVELAILKARETIEALRDGENTELDIVKLKRPKAKATKHGIKQDQVHANSGGEEFTSGKIKKSFNRGKMIISVRKARAYVLKKDREIERLLAKGVLDKEETEEIEQLKIRVEAVYRELTTQMNMLAKNKGGFGDFKKDDRDVEFTREQQQMADSTFSALEEAMKKVNSKLLAASTKQVSKLERDLREITKDLKELTMFFGRSS